MGASLQTTSASFHKWEYETDTYIRVDLQGGLAFDDRHGVTTAATKHSSDNKGGHANESSDWQKSREYVVGTGSVARIPWSSERR